MSRQADPPFTLLWRVFVEQFAANESATSDLQTRRAIIGVIAFLIAPGLFLMMKTMPDYELLLMVAKARNMPQMGRDPSGAAGGAVCVVLDEHDRPSDSLHLGRARVRQTRRHGARAASAAGFDDRQREAGRACHVSGRHRPCREHYLGCSVRVRHRRARGPHPSTPRRSSVRHDWRRSIRVLDARDCARVAGAARQRACRGDSGVVSAVSVPERRPVFHDGADRDRSGDPADFLVCGPLRAHSWIASGRYRPSRRPRAPRAAAVGRWCDRRHLRGILAANARGARAVCASGGNARAFVAASPRSSPAGIASRTRRPISC